MIEEGSEIEPVAEAAKVIGIRGILSRSTTDLPMTDDLTCEDLETNILKAEASVKKWNGADNGKFRAWFNLRNVATVSDELCLAIKDLAAKYKVGIHTHVSASQGSNVVCQKKFGKCAIERYADLGMLGSEFCMAHAGFGNAQEIEQMKEHDVKIMHCPITSMLVGFGIIE